MAIKILIELHQNMTPFLLKIYHMILASLLNRSLGSSNHRRHFNIDFARERMRQM